MSKPYPAYAARQWPRGEKADWRRIKKCSDPKAWYANMIGQTITVHYFCTFGRWDTEGRWLYFYDLSEPINEPFKQKAKNLFKRILK